MAITDPQAIRFVNEVIRPMAEKMRGLKAEIDAARAQYDGQVGTFFFGHGAEAIEDGREAEGVSRLVGNDILSFIAFALYDQKAAFEANGIPATIAKPCVRSIQVS
jgi:hypothetical protein